MFRHAIRLSLLIYLLKSDISHHSSRSQTFIFRYRGRSGVPRPLFGPTVGGYHRKIFYLEGLLLYKHPIWSLFSASRLNHDGFTTNRSAVQPVDSTEACAAGFARHSPLRSICHMPNSFPAMGWYCIPMERRQGHCAFGILWCTCCGIRCGAVLCQHQVHRHCPSRNTAVTNNPPCSQLCFLNSGCSQLI